MSKIKISESQLKYIVNYVVKKKDAGVSKDKTDINESELASDIKKIIKEGSIRRKYGLYGKG